MRKLLPLLLLAAAAGLTGIAILGGGSDEGTGLDGPRPGQTSPDAGTTAPRPKPPAATPGAAATALPSQPAAGAAAIDGRALRSDGIAARGAVVTVHDLPTEPGALPEARARAIAGDEGVFRFDGVAPGSHLVRATLEGFAPAAAFVRGLAAGEIRTVPLRLSPARRIAGRVVDENGDPVAGARVTAGPGAIIAAAAREPAFASFVPPAAAHGISGVDGSFEIDALPEGLFDVTATADGFLRGVAPGVRPTDENLFVVLRPTYGLLVRLTWEGEPPGAPEVLAADGTTGEPAGGDGSELLYRLPLDEGTHRVVARAVGFAPDEADVAVGPGIEFPEVSLRLGAGTEVVGRVLDEESGAPVPGAEVVFRALEILGRRPRDGGGKLRVRGKPDGTFLAKLGPGYWLATAEADGWLPPEKRADPIRVGSAPIEQDVFLRPERAAAGRVLWRDGRPADARAVCWSPAPHGLAGVRCDEDGRFRLVGLKPGVRYEVHARAGESEAVGPGIVLADGTRLAEIPDLVLDEPPAPDPREPPPEATLRGRVVGEGGRPIAGAVVAGLGTAATTDAAGRFELVGPASPARHGHAVTVRILAPARPPFAVRSLAAPPGVVTEAGDLLVPREGIWIGGRVTDEDRNPIPGAEVTATVGSFETTVRTDRQGEFRLEGPRSGGDAVVTARAPGYVDATDRKSTFRDAWLELVLHPPAAVTGKLVFAGDPPTWVDLLCNGRPYTRLPVTLEAGASFRVELPAHTRVDAIEAPGFLVHRLASDTRPGPGRTLDLGAIVLSRGGTVVVRIRDYAGRPLPDEPVEIRGPERYGKAVSDAAGEIRFTALSRGTYRIRGRVDWTPVTETVEIEGEETKRIELTLP